MWDYIKKEIFSIIDKYVPSKISSSKTHQPWINTATKKLIRKKKIDGYTKQKHPIQIKYGKYIGKLKV